MSMLKAILSARPRYHTERIIQDDADSLSLRHIARLHVLLRLHELDLKRVAMVATEYRQLAYALGSQLSAVHSRRLAADHHTL